MKCPQCNEKELTKDNINGIMIDYCSECGGLWLDKGELNNIIHQHDGDVEFCTEEHIENSTKTTLPCPNCQNEKLIEVNFIEYSNIRISFCQVCNGIWLKKGDLENINKEIDNLQDEADSWYHKIMLFCSKLPFN